MATVHLRGPGLDSWFAEQMVNDHGPEEALNRSCGPMREAVQRLILAEGILVDESKVDPPLNY